MTVSGTNLSMVRGDSEAILVTPSVAFEPGDVVFFTVRRVVDSPIMIQKTITTFIDGAAHISIEPEDTQTLRPGTYVYDIQVTWADGSVKTLVEKSEFRIKEEVTY